MGNYLLKSTPKAATRRDGQVGIAPAPSPGTPGGSAQSFSFNFSKYLTKTQAANTYLSKKTFSNLIKDYPKKNKDEIITGHWSFEKTRLTDLADCNYSDDLKPDDVIGWNGITFTNLRGFTREGRDEVITGKWSYDEDIKLKEKNGIGLNLPFCKIFSSEYDEDYAGNINPDSEKNLYIKLKEEDAGVIFNDFENQPFAELRSDGDFYLTGNQFIDGNLTDKSGFSSGFAGAGWELDTQKNHLTIDNLTVRKSMRVYDLQINKIRATNGSLWVSDAVEIVSVNYYNGDYTLTVDTGKDNLIPFVIGDIIKAQVWSGNAIKYCECVVNDIDQSTGEVIVRSYDITGEPPEPGMTFVRIGNIDNPNRQGAIYLTASDDNAPYLDVIDGYSSIGDNFDTKVRIGKLDGITDTSAGLSGNQKNYYGLYSTNVHLKGTIVADRGKVGGWNIENGKLSAMNIELDNSGFLRHTGNKWRFNTDGSFSLGSGGITGDDKGNITMSVETELSWGKDPRNLIDWRNEWEEGNGGTENYNRNGSITENERAMIASPFGSSVLGWICKPDSNNDGDGGWNTNYFPMDKRTGYRYTVWFKRTGSVNGQTYHGCHGVTDLGADSENTNPYFWYGDPPNLNEWYLLVGVVHPEGYAGGYSGISGVYDMNGRKVLIGTEFKWFSGANTCNWRSYLYYCHDTNVRQYFYNPMVHKLDGTEPSLNDVIGNRVITTHLNNNGVYTGTLTAGQVTGTNADFKTGSFGGWKASDGYLYSGNRWGSGSYGGLTLREKDPNNPAWGSLIIAHKDASSFVRMFYNSPSDWGISGQESGNVSFHLGSVNKIGGFNFDSNTINQVDSSGLGIKLDSNSQSIKLMTSESHAKGRVLFYRGNEKTGNFLGQLSGGTFSDQVGWSGTTNEMLWSTNGRARIETTAGLSLGHLPYHQGKRSFSTYNAYEFSVKGVTRDYDVLIYKDSSSSSTITLSNVGVYTGKIITIITQGGKVWISTAAGNHVVNSNKARQFTYNSNTKKWHLIE